MKGILFTVLSHERNDIIADLAESSPFHDDTNDGYQDPEDTMLREYQPGEEASLPSNNPLEDEETVRIIKSGRRGDSSKMRKRMIIQSGHQCGWKMNGQIDFVDENQEKNKLLNMEKLKKENELLENSGVRWPDAHRDRPRRTVPMNRMERAMGVGKPVSSELRAIAEGIGAEPTSLMYPRWMQTLNNKDKVKVMRACKSQNRTAAVWNFVVEQLNPVEQFRRSRPKITLENVLDKDGNPRVIRQYNGSPGYPVVETIKMSRYIRKGSSNIQSGLSGICHHDVPRSEGFLASNEFMNKVEAGEDIPGVQTKCNITGISLLHKKERGQKHWVLMPTFQGMSIRTLKVVVDAGAVVAGLVKGKIQDAPECVYEIAKDGDAWALFAVVTGNPRWKEVAEGMLRMRDKLYFGLTDQEVDENIRERKQMERSLRPFRNVG